MKKFTKIPMILILVIAFSSCDKIKDAIKTDIDISPNGVEFNLPVISSTSELTVIDIASPINIDSIIKKKTSEYGIGNLKSVKITALKLEIINGFDDSNSFANLESISASVQAAGQSAIVVASIPNNPDVKTSVLNIPILAEAADLKKVFSAGDFTYKLTVKARRATTKQMHLRVTADYTLTVGL